MFAVYTSIKRTHIENLASNFCLFMLFVTY